MKYTKLDFLLVLSIFVAVAGGVLLQIPSNTMLARSVQNLMHIPLFAFLAFFLFQLLSEKIRRTGWLHFSVVAIAMGLGVLIELLQYSSGRLISLVDIARDLIGMVIGLLLIAGVTRRIRWPVIITIILALLSKDGFDLIRLIKDYQARNQAFPVLLDLNVVWARTFSGLRLGKRDGANIIFSPGKYPGLAINEPYPDWRGYESLVIEVENLEKKPFYPVIRVNDAIHNQHHDDRFNRQFIASPGKNSFTVSLKEIQLSPKDRELDLANIAQIILFLPRPTHEVHVRVNEIRLE